MKSLKYDQQLYEKLPSWRYLVRATDKYSDIYAPVPYVLLIYT